MCGNGYLNYGIISHSIHIVNHHIVNPKTLQIHINRFFSLPTLSKKKKKKDLSGSRIRNPRNTEMYGVS